MSVSTVRVRGVDGGSRESDFELVERADCASVLLYDGMGRVALLRQFRPGAVEHDGDAFVLELAAGMIDEGESPDEAALREVGEETGLDSSGVELHKIGVFYLSPGGSNERCHLYLGLANLDAIDTSVSHGLESEGEFIRIEVMALEDAIKACGLHSSNITLFSALMSLQAISG